MSSLPQKPRRGSKLNGTLFSIDARGMTVAAEKRKRFKDRGQAARDYKQHACHSGCIGCEVCLWTAPDFIKEILFLTSPIHLSPLLEVHHVFPVCLGGSDAFDNLILLCPNCHAIADRLSKLPNAMDFGIHSKEDLKTLLNDICGHQRKAPRFETMEIGKDDRERLRHIGGKRFV